MTDKEKKPWHDGLTPKERRFVEEYLVDLNQSQAFIRAGYSKNANSVYTEAYRLRHKRRVADAIERLLEERGISSLRILDEVAKIAFANIGDYVRVVALNGGDYKVVITPSDELSVDQLAAIAEISESISEFGTAIKVRPYDKLTALGYLLKIKRMMVERQELSGPNGGPIEYKETVEDVRKRIKDRLLRLKGSGESNESGS